jgi:hypothetical protein
MKLMIKTINRDNKKSYFGGFKDRMFEIKELEKYQSLLNKKKLIKHTLNQYNEFYSKENLIKTNIEFVIIEILILEDNKNEIIY